MRGTSEPKAADLFDVRNLYATAQVGLGYFDASLKSCYINQWLARVIGFATVGYFKDPVDALAPDLADRLVPILQQVLKSRKPVIDWQYVSPANAGPLPSRCCSYSFYPDQDPRGKIVGISCVVLDVTRRTAGPDSKSDYSIIGDEELTADVGASELAKAETNKDSLDLASGFGKVAQAIVPFRGPSQNDTLTGLGNWGLFERQLQHLISISERRNEEVASLVIGLDGFKEFGDLYGPAVSDAALRVVAARLGEVLREADQKFRIVGSEFAVLLEPKSKALNGAFEAADKIAQHLVSPIEVGGQRCAMGVSIGISVFPGHGRDARLLFGKAVEAMYRAKRKHQVVLEASNVDGVLESSRPESKVFRLIYVSTAVRPISDRALIEMMREGRSRSERLQITGMMLYKDGHFIHVLEGDETKVRGVLSDNEHDRLQRSVDVLRSGHFYDRSFPDWTMGFEGSESSSEPAYTRFLDPQFKPDYLDEESVEAHAILLAFKGDPKK